MAALKQPVVVSTHISNNVTDNENSDLNNHHNQEDIPTTICAFEHSVISKVPIFKSVIESTNQLKSENSTTVNDSETIHNNNNETEDSESGEVRNLLLLTTATSSSSTRNSETPMVESELRKSQSDDVIAVPREFINNNPSVITSGLTQSRLLQNNNRYDNNYVSNTIMVNPNVNRYGNYTINFSNVSNGLNQSFNTGYSWPHDLSIKSSDIVTKEELEKVNNNNNEDCGDEHTIHDAKNNNHYTILDGNTHGIDHQNHDNNNHHDNHNIDDHHQHHHHHQHQHNNSHHNSPSNDTIVNNISTDSTSEMRGCLLRLTPYSNYVDQNCESSGAHGGGSDSNNNNHDDVNVSNTQHQQSTIDEVIANTLEGESCALDSHQLTTGDDGQHHHYITLSTANDLHNLKVANSYSNNHNSASSCGDSRSPSGYSQEDFDGEYAQLVSSRNAMFPSGGIQTLGGDHGSSLIHSTPYEILHPMPSR